MSFTIDVAFVQQFSANVRMLAEQKTSVMRPTVMTDSKTGESWAVERLGSVEAQQFNDRHGDTPLNSTPHTRRWGFGVNYDVADQIDRADKVKLLIDPASAYTVKHSSALGRKVDYEILRAMQASAVEGHTGATTTALASTYKIVSSSVGLTVAKLISAKQMLDAQEIDTMDRHFVGASTDITALLSDERVTSADYNTVKALVQGDINTYLGFEFHRCERVADTALLVSAERMTYAYHRSAVELGIVSDVESTAGVAPTKRFAQILYSWMQIGAVRVEDAALVQIACA